MIDRDLILSRICGGQNISYAEFVEFFDLDSYSEFQKPSHEVKKIISKVFSKTLDAERFVHSLAYCIPQEEYFRLVKELAYSKQKRKTLDRVLRLWLGSVLQSQIQGMDKDRVRYALHVSMCFLYYIPSRLLGPEKGKSGNGLDPRPHGDQNERKEWYLWHIEDSVQQLSIENFGKIIAPTINRIKTISDERFKNIAWHGYIEAYNGYTSKSVEIARELFPEVDEYFHGKNKEVLWGPHHYLSGFLAIEMGLEELGEETRQIIIGF